MSSKISIVIPYYQGDKDLLPPAKVLASESARFECEVLIANNEARPLPTKLVERLPADVRVIDASSRRGNAAARNIGASAATGDLVAFCDQDDVPAEGWLLGLTEASLESELVIGRIELLRRGGHVTSSQSSAPRSSDVDLRYPFGFLPYGLSTNMLIRRSALLELGGFDERYKSSCDVELCWRAQLQGMSLAYASDAVVIKARKSTCREAFFQHLSYGVDAPRLYRAYRASGMPGRRLLTIKQLLALARDLSRPSSRDRAYCAARLGGDIAGRLLGSYREQVMYV